MPLSKTERTLSAGPKGRVSLQALFYRAKGHDVQDVEGENSMRRSTTILTAVLTGSTVLLAAAPAHATAHGKNGRIAFRRYYNADHTRGDIFTITAHGTRQRQVTHTRRTRLATEPDWSPNGRWIEYQISRHGNTEISRLYKIHPNGTHRTFLSGSCVAPCRTDGFAQWSPHGRRIAFQRQFGPAGDPTFLFALFVMRANGTHVRQITHRGADPLGEHRLLDKAPTWSPNAKRLAFECVYGPTDHHAIFTVRLDGTHRKRITRWALDAAQPDWSPNGRWIMFRSKANSDTDGNMWLVHPNGTGLHRVTHDFGATGKWGSASFSPNGRRIVAAKNPGVGSAGNADVYVMRLDGSHMRNVTTSFAWESAPDWGPRRR
jgi:TolB protein